MDEFVFARTSLEDSMHQRLALSTLAVALILGCLSSSSGNRSTGEIRIFFHADKKGDGRIHLHVRATDGRSDFSWLDSLPLDSDEEFVASANGQVVRFHGTTATIEGDPSTVTLALHRSAGVDAPNTIIDFPEPFVLEAIDTEVPRSVPLHLQWKPVGAEPMEIEIEGDCIQRVSKTVASDKGSTTVTVRAATDVGSSTACMVSLVVTRTRLGAVDKAFMSGSKAFGREIRYATFKSVP